MCWGVGASARPPGAAGFFREGQLASAVGRLAPCPASGGDRGDSRALPKVTGPPPTPSAHVNFPG